mgnify:CR=1 FL=1
MTDPACPCHAQPDPPTRSRCRLCGRIAGASAEHTCHAVGCRVVVAPKLLFCLRHWRLVPKAMQRRVWAAYVPGQEVRKDPTQAYLDVQREVVAYVAALEGKAV